MLFRSEHVTSASGSIGGVTYSHNRSGMYRRARAVPVNPNTGNQIEVRNAMTSLVNAWTELLTAAQRTSWNLYAANVPVTNPLGASVNNSGQNWYIGNNVPRLQVNSKITPAVLPRVDDGPVIFDRSLLTTPTVDVLTALTDLEFGFTNTDEWATALNGALLVYMGAPQNASRQFFKGPFRLIGFQEGAVIPPVGPLTVTSALATSRGFSFSAGQAVWFKFVATTADGRLSSPQIVGPTIVQV